MKKISLFLFAALAVATLFTSCGNKNQYTINGTVDAPELNGGWIYVFNFYGDSMDPQDSVQLVDGKFTIQGTVDEPWIAMIGNPEIGIFPVVVVEPGTIELTMDKVSGTPLNDRLQAFNDNNDFSDIDSIMEANIPLYYAAETAEERAEIEHFLDSVEAVGNARVIKAYWTLYGENSDNILAVKAINEIISVDGLAYRQLDSIVKVASPCVANNSAVKAALEQMRCVEETSVGKHYTDIQGVDGKLSDLIDGKLALVDFYASWCGPCRNEIKDNLVPLWSKYEKKGLVIVGLNVWERGDAAERKAAHEKVMADLGITYPQLVDTTRTATTTYGVQSIPQILLIAPDGTILGRNLRGAAIEEAIIEAMK